MDVTTYLILNKKKYFAIAEEYIELQQRFKTETFYETLSLFMKLVGNLIISFLWKSNSMSIALTLYRMVEDWKEYIRYRSLQSDLSEWKRIVHSTGGPIISTNDPMFQPYVYAHTMQVYHDALFGLTEKGAKCIE